jgi:hypothetical protein
MDNDDDEWNPREKVDKCRAGDSVDSDLVLAVNTGDTTKALTIGNNHIDDNRWVHEEKPRRFEVATVVSLKRLKAAETVLCDHFDAAIVARRDEIEDVDDHGKITPFGFIAIVNVTAAASRKRQKLPGDMIFIFLRGKSRSVVVESLVVFSPMWLSLLLLWVRKSLSSSLGVRSR